MLLDVRHSEDVTLSTTNDTTNVGDINSLILTGERTEVLTVPVLSSFVKYLSHLEDASLSENVRSLQGRINHPSTAEDNELLHKPIGNTLDGYEESTSQSVASVEPSGHLRQNEELKISSSDRRTNNNPPLSKG